MNRLRSSLTDFGNTLEKSKLKLSGRLGIPLGGQQIVEVPNRNSFVYVRLRNNQNEIIQAFNNQVSPAYDLPVLVRREGIFYVIDGVDVGMYESYWPNFSPYLPRHGATHSFTDDGSGGGDMVWVYGRQFMPMLIIPSGSSGAPDAFLAPYLLRNLAGQWKYIGNTGTPNLTIYDPTGSYGVMVLVYVDISTGNPGIIVNSGSYFPATKTGTADLVPYLPALPINPNLVPVSAIRLVSGTFVIGWDNIYDARQYFSVIPTGTSGGGGGGGGVGDGIGVFGENAGIPLGTGTIFNVIGSRISLTISGSTLQLTNSPDPQEFIGVYGQNQGTSLGTGTTLNVSGSRLSLSLVGSILILTNSPDPVDNIGVFIQDEGTPIATGTILNFVGPNVSASVSGTVARIFITGSTGGGIPSGTIQIFNSGTFLGSMDKINFQYPLAAGFTGTMGYAYLNGFLLAWEDVSAQITGSNAHFTLTGTIAQGTDRLYYNGLRQQRITHYLVDANGRGFSTLFTGTFGDALIMEYGNAGATPQNDGISILDGGVSKGFAYGISFDAGLDASIDASGIAHISGSTGGGGGGSGGAPTGAMYLLGKAESSLPSGVVITGLLASADVDGRNGLGLSYEFDQTGTATNFTWSNPPSFVNSHVDFMSYMHIVHSGTTNKYIHGRASYTPTGSFDLRTKISSGKIGSGTNSFAVGFGVSNATDDYSVFFQYSENINSQRKEIVAFFGTGTFTNSGGYLTNFQIGTVWNMGTMSGPLYLRITKQPPELFRWFISTDGIGWTEIGELIVQNLNINKAYYMLFQGQPATATELFVDWLRSNV